MLVMMGWDIFVIHITSTLSHDSPLSTISLFILALVVIGRKGSDYEFTNYRFKQT